MGKLNILCTSSDKDTMINMVGMYSSNYFKNGTWDAINIILWGGSIRLVGEDADVQNKIKNLLKIGITIKACKACADKMKFTDTLKELGLDVKYMGTELTNAIKSDDHLITI